MTQISLIQGLNHVRIENLPLVIAGVWFKISSPNYAIRQLLGYWDTRRLGGVVGLDVGLVNDSSLVRFPAGALPGSLG